jgi:formylglycine-generating enzyme required for sulfatase activity
LKATGPGFHWSARSTLQLLNVTPDQGDLAADGTIEVVATLVPAAQSVLPRQYDGQLIFKNISSGDVTMRNAKLIVLPRPQPLPPVAETNVAVPLSPERERALKPMDRFKECANCPEMVVVPAGSFTMGSPGSEAGRYPNEGPQHLVTFAKLFAVSRFTLTFDEWDACLADGGCNSYRPADQSWGRGRRPVIYVSWNDAKGYLSWLSRKTEKPYRLLSESEREYVTRAGTTTAYWWGSSILSSQANYSGRQTLPVDSFAPNPWGLFQVHGNIWDWTEDCYQNSYKEAPTVGLAVTKGDCSRRVTRGGAWRSIPEYLRSASRDSEITDARNNGLGIRLARTLAP